MKTNQNRAITQNDREYFQVLPEPEAAERMFLRHRDKDLAELNSLYSKVYMEKEANLSPREISESGGVYLLMHYLGETTEEFISKTIAPQLNTLIKISEDSGLLTKK